MAPYASQMALPEAEMTVEESILASAGVENPPIKTNPLKLSEGEQSPVDVNLVDQSSPPPVALSFEQQAALSDLLGEASANPTPEESFSKPSLMPQLLKQLISTSLAISIKSRWMQ